MGDGRRVEDSGNMATRKSSRDADPTLTWLYRYEQWFSGFQIWLKEDSGSVLHGASG